MSQFFGVIILVLQLCNIHTHTTKLGVGVEVNVINTSPQLACITLHIDKMVWVPKKSQAQNRQQPTWMLTKAFMWCIIKPWLLQHWQSPSTSNSQDLKTRNLTLTTCFHLKQILLHIESIYYFKFNVWSCPGHILQLLIRTIYKNAVFHGISIAGPVVMKYIQKVCILVFLLFPFSR